jgi:hypothetical protein
LKAKKGKGSINSPLFPFAETITPQRRTSHKLLQPKLVRSKENDLNFGIRKLKISRMQSSAFRVKIIFSSKQSRKNKQTETIWMKFTVIIFSLAVLVQAYNAQSNEKPKLIKTTKPFCCFARQ